MDSGHIKQYIIGVTVSLVYVSTGLVYGWSAPVMVRLLSNESEIPMTESEGAYVVAAVELGSALSPIPAGLIADRFGCKPVIQSILPIIIFSWALVIFTRSLKVLILARITFGMAIGVVASVCPIYLGEIAEHKIRGKVTSLCIVFWFVGILAAYCVGPYVSYDNFSYISVSLSMILVFGLIFIPESPYNLLSRGKYELAKNALKKLRSGNDASIEKEITSIKTAINEIHEEKMSFMTLFVDPSCRMSFLLVNFLAVIAYFGGVTVMYAYATEIFQTIDGIPLNADQCTIFLGFIYLVLSMTVTGVVDLFGRRPLLLVSAGGSGVSQFITGLYYYLQNCVAMDVSSYGWILLLAMGSYCVFTSVGISPVISVYQGEVFPDGIKGIASGLFIVEQGCLSMIALKLFQVINLNFGKHVSFWLFSFFNISGFILLYFYLIETKGKTLAEIQREFKMRTKKSKANIIDFRETVPFKSDS